MVKTHNRIIAGVLSTLMVGQVTFFGDGTTKGILHPDTIAYAAEEIKTRANERELAEEFERAIQGIGEVDYFDSSSSSTTNSTRRTRSLSSTSPLSDKQELFDYINKDDREKDPIEAMSFFSHGTAFDVPGVSNPGYKNQYALALGYGGSGKHNNSLNIFTSEISQINSKSFAKNSSTVFYSCRTGKKFNNVSFAQEWANTTGGTVKAATNRTDYTHIYPNPIPGLDSINSILGYSGRSPRQEARYIHGYSTSGSKNYPKGKWKTFTPK